MAKKDIPTIGAYSAEKLGKKLYLWSGGSYKQKLVITAHGGYTLSNKPFKVPANMAILFYAPHGFILKDPGIKAVSQGTVTPYDTYSAGSVCPNYKLSKYQGSHGGKPGAPAETYTNIAHDMHKGVEVAQTEAFLGKPLDEAGLAMIKDVTMDVVTIRNRAMSKSPTLEEVIETISSQNLGYTEIHCSFCRCRMGLPDELDMSYDAKQSKVV